MKRARISVAALMVFVLIGFAIGQDEKKKESVSIGGEEHNAEIYGVKIGMDIPTALKAVFDNANRKEGEEKPDAMRKEGKNDKDIRVVYNELPKGELQIVFAGGKIVREITLVYKERPNIDDLRLASDSSLGVAAGGQRYDDRYTIGFVDRQKQEKLWWRDEDTDKDYKIRVSFRSGHIRKDGQLWWQTVAVKSVFVDKSDVKSFNEANDIKY